MMLQWFKQNHKMHLDKSQASYFTEYFDSGVNFGLYV